MRLQPQTYQPNHQRDGSDASSVYSAHRMSTHQHKNSSSTDMSFNYSYPENSNRNSASLNPPSKDSSRRPSDSSSLLAPGSAASNDKTHDPRFSEFYDAVSITRASLSANICAHSFIVLHIKELASCPSEDRDIQTTKRPQLAATDHRRSALTVAVA